MTIGVKLRSLVPATLIGLVFIAGSPGLALDCVDYGDQVVPCGAVTGDPTGVELMAVTETDLLLVVTDAQVLSVYGLGDPETPAFLAETSLGADYEDLACAQDVVYLCGPADGGVRILRVGTDGAVVDLGNLFTETCTVTGLDVDGDLLGVCLGDTWSLWDCSDPAAPQLSATVDDGYVHTDIALDGDQAVTWDTVAGLNLYDLSTPAPTWVDGGFEGVTNRVERLHVVLVDGIAFVTSTSAVYWSAGYSSRHKDTGYLETIEMSSASGMTLLETREVGFTSGGLGGYITPVMTRVGDRIIETNDVNHRMLVAESSASSLSGIGVAFTDDCLNVLAGTGDVIYGAHETGIDILRLPVGDVGYCPASALGEREVAANYNVWRYLDDVAVGDGYILTYQHTHTIVDVADYDDYAISVYDPDVSLVEPVHELSGVPYDIAWLGDVLLTLQYYVYATDMSVLPEEPTTVLLLEAHAEVVEVLSSGQLAIAADGLISIYDMSDLGAPVLLSTLPAGADELVFDGTYLLALYDEEVSVIDIGDPSSPFVAGSVPVPVRYAAHMTVLSGDRVLVASDANTYSNPRPPCVVDYGDPSVPVVAETWDFINVSSFNVSLGGLTYVVGDGVHLLNADGSEYIGCLGAEHSILGAVAFEDHIYSISWGGLMEIPQDCNSTVPVWLARCNLDLAGECPVLVWCLGDDSSDADFIVEAQSGVRTWTVPVRSLGDGLFEARDTSAAGLQVDVTYRLYAEQDGARTLLAEQTYTPSSTPSAVRLVSIAPNPFNPRTQVTFTLDRPRDVNLKVYDAAGRCVRTLWSGLKAAGPHTAEWNGLNDAGGSVASGAYFFRLESDAGVQSRKALLVR